MSWNSWNYPGPFHCRISRMAETKKVDVDLLEEDDEFEEFPQDDWDVRKEDQSDINVWEENWDDDKTDSEFSNHLRQVLETQGEKQETKQ